MNDNTNVRNSIRCTRRSFSSCSALWLPSPGGSRGVAIVADDVSRSLKAVTNLPLLLPPPLEFLTMLLHRKSSVHPFSQFMLRLLSCGVSQRLGWNPDYSHGLRLGATGERNVLLLVSISRPSDVRTCDTQKPPSLPIARHSVCRNVCTARVARHASSLMTNTHICSDNAALNQMRICVHLITKVGLLWIAHQPEGEPRRVA